jgi:hypothetical protein
MTLPDLGCLLPNAAQISTIRRNRMVDAESACLCGRDDRTPKGQITGALVWW